MRELGPEVVIDRMQGAGAVEAPYTGFLLFIYIRAMWSVGITMVTREHNPLNPIFWTGCIHKHKS